MKRRKFLIALGVVPPLVLSACKENVIPATIIMGKVMDEKGMPIENIPFTFWGYRSYGGSAAGGGKQDTTFKVEKQSDKDGIIAFSQVVPQNTTDVYLLIGNINFPFYKYTIQSKKGGVSIGAGTENIAVYPDYANTIDSLILAQTNEYEIILTKK